MCRRCRQKRKAGRRTCLAVRVGLLPKGAQIADDATPLRNATRETRLCVKGDEKGQVTWNEKLGFAVEFSEKQWDGVLVLELTQGQSRERVGLAGRFQIGPFAKEQDRQALLLDDDKLSTNISVVWEPPSQGTSGHVVSSLWEHPLGALFAAFERFAEKLPAYSQQVAERLVDNKRDGLKRGPGAILDTALVALHRSPAECLVDMRREWRTVLHISVGV